MTKITNIHWERLKYPWSKNEDPVKFWLSIGGLFLFVFSFAVLHNISTELGLTPNTGGLATLPPGYNPAAFQPGGYGGYPSYPNPNSPALSGQSFGYRPRDYYSAQQYGYYQQGQSPIYYGNNQYGGMPGYGYGSSYNQYPGYGSPYGSPYGYGGGYGAGGGYPQTGGYGSQYGGGYGQSPYYNPGNVPVFRAVKTPSEPQQTIVENQAPPQNMPSTTEQTPPQQPSKEIQIERTHTPPPPTVFEPSKPVAPSKKLSNTFLYVVLVFAILLWLYLIYFMFKPKPHPHAPSKPSGFETSDLAQLEFHKPSTAHSSAKPAAKKKKH